MNVKNIKIKNKQSYTNNKIIKNNKQGNKNNKQKQSNTNNKIVKNNEQGNKNNKHKNKELEKEHILKIISIFVSILKNQVKYKEINKSTTRIKKRQSNNKFNYL